MIIHAKIATLTGVIIFLLGLLYAAVTLCGLLSITSVTQPIGQPYLTIMELLILLIAPLMACQMVSQYYLAGLSSKIYGLVAAGCMFITVAITSCVHFSVLVLNAQYPPEISTLFTFHWPSPVYALDILAWDWFFPLAMFFGAIQFNTARQKTARRLMITSGLLSLAGLAGVPWGNMQVRNIGILGYAVVAPVTFMYIGVMLRKERSFYNPAL